MAERAGLENRIPRKRDGGSNPSLSETGLFTKLIMAFVYILYSPSRQCTYAGCSEIWQERLATHNAGRVAATRSGVPWRLVHLEDADNMLLARRRESYLKTSAGRRWLKHALGELA